MLTQQLVFTMQQQGNHTHLDMWRLLDVCIPRGKLGMLAHTQHMHDTHICVTHRHAHPLLVGWLNLKFVTFVSFVITVVFLKASCNPNTVPSYLRQCLEPHSEQVTCTL